ncbi:GNAT family N-acetyltransferase [Salinimonas sp. HHU 13199]|uniref:GNAT family N-acetyltransferase n=1 Tax=Salinimonas profundi TaxID=2729140 RepID=A0ABR8LHT2_9ALTE|nr:GNAT family N-acetyltransferase [Salinimonas profundi]MBD3584531.1 GNAT family N-acetyltransferase [Salinimonas profundi]
MKLSYRVNEYVSCEQFIALLNASGLGERRPVDDKQCIEGMLNNSNLIIAAWHDEQLVGIARSVTDFHYACYLSDLAVHKNYQHLGLGKTLQNLTQQKLGPNCKIILLAAPDANSYYQKLGFTSHPRCWVLERNKRIKE